MPIFDDKIRSFIKTCSIMTALAPVVFYTHDLIPLSYAPWTSHEAVAIWYQKGILVWSDLHLEFGKFESPTIDRDVLVLAGDIHIEYRAANFILNQLQYGDVIYVLGNHESYNSVLLDIRQTWAKIIQPDTNKNAKRLGYPGHFYFLDDDTVTINDVTFIGATLWSDFRNGNPISMMDAKSGISDYTCIYHGSDDSHRLITPDDTLHIHRTSKEFIETHLRCPGRKVVVTHHLPSFQSIYEKFHEDDNGSFASNLDQLMYDYQPELWIHGHTHFSMDYMIDKTRIVCNPRGYYPHGLNLYFKEIYVIEL